MKGLVTAVLLLWYMLLPSFGFGGSSDTTTYWTGHLFYPLSHANVWHLFANVLCLWMIPCRLHLLSSYAVAVVCSFLPCFLSEPTMGFSGVLFAVVGRSWGVTGRFRQMLWKNKWFLVIPFFLPHVNGFIHVYCMLSGYVVGYFRCCKKISA